jgi:hypothetical protein
VDHGASTVWRARLHFTVQAVRLEYPFSPFTFPMTFIVSHGAGRCDRAVTRAEDGVHEMRDHRRRCPAELAGAAMTRQDVERRCPTPVEHTTAPFTWST